MTLVTAVIAASMAVATAGATAHGPDIEVHERFVPAAHADAHRAITYDTSAVPASSTVTVTERRTPDGGTQVTLRLHGVTPRHTFGAHAHAKSCGRNADDSGPHYQDVPDPRQPSVDPRYANPRNEVWLDLSTDEHGDGHSESVEEWRFRAGEANSVVVHEHATSRRPGEAGQAGARLACVTVPFR